MTSPSLFASRNAAQRNRDRRNRAPTESRTTTLKRPQGSPCKRRFSLAINSPKAPFSQYDRGRCVEVCPMQIGRFFSLRQGRVGQYLARRVLVVRSPFRAASPTLCYFGFDHLKQAQTFAQKLASMGASFQIRRSRIMPHAYEIQLRGHYDLAQTLAYWERQGEQRAMLPSHQTSAPPEDGSTAIAA